MKMFRKSILCSAALAAGLVGTQANALTFNLIDTGGTAVGTQARNGFQVAANYWSSVFADNVTVNLNIGFSTLGPNILGSTGSTTASVYNRAYYNSLNADRTSALDNAAVANLQPLTAGTGSTAGTGAITVIGNALNGATTAASTGYIDTATRIDNDGSANNRGLSMNTTIAKALGITTTFTGATINYAAADGTVRFSNAFAFDFNPTDGIDANSFDFIGVAIHEIGHALGFRSGVDLYDAYTAPGGSSANANALENFVNVATQLDFFRYSSAGNLDWSTQNTPYFSLDGGVNQLFGDSRFSTGVANGDGRQASHWKDSVAGVPQLGILDPTSGRGQAQEVTALDLAAYDAIGWNVNFDVLANSGYRYTTAQAFTNLGGQVIDGVPEPMTWVQMLLGFGLLGGAMRSVRREVRVVSA